MTIIIEMSPKRGTTDLRMPITKDGEKDKRYKDPQICNKDGKRDKRCKLMDINRKKLK
jgi:hypothetical protein